MKRLATLALVACFAAAPIFAEDKEDSGMQGWKWANFLVLLFRTSPTAQGLFLQVGQNWTSSYYAGIGTVLPVAVAIQSE